MCASFDTQPGPNRKDRAMRKKREPWNVQMVGGKIVVLAARSKDEAMRLAKKRGHGEPSAAWAGSSKTNEKPKVHSPVRAATAKPAKAPAVMATPENIKALAREAVAEYIRDGFAAFVRGLMGA